MQRFLNGEAAHFDFLGTMSTQTLLGGQREMVVAWEWPAPMSRRGSISHAHAGDRIGADRVAPGDQKPWLLSLEPLDPGPFSARDRFDAIDDCKIDWADADHIHRHSRNAVGGPSGRSRVHLNGQPMRRPN